MISRDDSVRDLALKSGCEAVPHPGKADFELIDVHGMLPLGFLDQSSTSDLNFRSDFAVNLRGLQHNCAANFVAAHRRFAAMMQRSVRDLGVLACLYCFES
jgi:hypothetical protein